jgi:hypothetical protein
MKIHHLSLAIAASIALIACGSGISGIENSGSSVSENNTANTPNVPISTMTYKIDGVTYTDAVKGISVPSAIDSGRAIVIEAGESIASLTDIETSGSCEGSGDKADHNVYSFKYSGYCGRKIIIGTAKGSFQLDVTIEPPVTIVFPSPVQPCVYPNSCKLFLPD